MALRPQGSALLRTGQRRQAVFREPLTRQARAAMFEAVAATRGGRQSTKRGFNGEQHGSFGP